MSTLSLTLPPTSNVTSSSTPTSTSTSSSTLTTSSASTSFSTAQILPPNNLQQSPNPQSTSILTSSSSAASSSPSSSIASQQHLLMMDNLNLSNNLSSSCSSLSSIASTMSQNSSSLGNELGVYLMLYNSIEITSNRYKNEEIFFKISAFDMKANPSSNTNDGEESMGIGDDIEFEISVMNSQQLFYSRQAPEGRPVHCNELIMCRARIPVADEQFGIRVDLFKKISISTGSLSENNVSNGMFVYDKIAFCYIYPLDIASSNGICSMPITTKTGKLIARFRAEYFVAKPYQGLSNEIKIKSKIRNAKSWQLKKEGFDIGHRGAGVARRNDHTEKVLENTVESFNYAFKKGADMVELDVQLSKDKIPIVYHDFNVNIQLQKKDKQTETFVMNIGHLTFEQLQALKTNPVLKPGKEFYDFAQDSHEGLNQHNQPFASLRYVLENVDPECGFNVEIKYPQKKINGQWESEKSHDVNEFVDLILQDLFLYAGDRNIIISSFHPEICSLVKLKQDRYPVLFLTQGLTQKWMAYENPLNHSIEMATYLAVSMGLYGIAVHAEDIINDRKLIKFVKSFPLILFCWGDDLNDKHLIKQLKAEGVDGAIYDKIDLLVAKEIQTSMSTAEPMEIE